MFMERTIPSWKQIIKSRKQISWIATLAAAVMMFLSIGWLFSYFDYISTLTVLQSQYELDLEDEIAKRLGLKSQFDQTPITDEALANFNPDDLVRKERIVHKKDTVLIYYNGIIYEYNELANPLEHECYPEKNMRPKSIFVVVGVILSLCLGILTILKTSQYELDNLLKWAKYRGYMKAVIDHEKHNVDYDLQLYAYREQTEKFEEDKSICDELKDLREALRESTQEERNKQRKAKEQKLDELEVELEAAEEAEENGFLPSDFDPDFVQELDQIIKNADKSAQAAVARTKSKGEPEETESESEPETFADKRTYPVPMSVSQADERAKAEKAAANKKKATTTKKPATEVPESFIDEVKLPVFEEAEVKEEQPVKKAATKKAPAKTTKTTQAAKKPVAKKTTTKTTTKKG